MDHLEDPRARVWQLMAADARHYGAEAARRKGHDEMEDAKRSEASRIET
jgi:hypothetical protein